MPKNLTGKNRWADPVPVPQDGDIIEMAGPGGIGNEQLYQDFLDRDTYVNTRVTTLEGRAGIPAGGLPGQVLTKVGPADFAVGWQPVPSGPGGNGDGGGPSNLIPGQILFGGVGGGIAQDADFTFVNGELGIRDRQYPEYDMHFYAGEILLNVHAGVPVVQSAPAMRFGMDNLTQHGRFAWEIAAPPLGQWITPEGWAYLMTLTPAALALSVPVDMQTRKITGLGNPDDPQDAATKAYVDGRPGGDGQGGIPDATSDGFAYGRLNGTWARVLTLAGGAAGTMTGALTLHADPTTDYGAATKRYVDNLLALRATLASPTFTGTPAAPTAAAATNTTQIATTAYVKSQNYLTANQSITLSGDVTGAGTTAIAATVARLQGRPMASTAPGTNQVLQWSGAQWQPATIQTGGNGGGPVTGLVQSQVLYGAAGGGIGQDAGLTYVAAGDYRYLTVAGATVIDTAPSTTRIQRYRTPGIVGSVLSVNMTQSDAGAWALENAAQAAYLLTFNQGDGAMAWYYVPPGNPPDFKTLGFFTAEGMLSIRGSLRINHAFDTPATPNPWATHISEGGFLVNVEADGMPDVPAHAGLQYGLDNSSPQALFFWLYSPAPQASPVNWQNIATLGVSGLDMYNKRISHVLDPEQAQDAATKAYVDTHAGGNGGVGVGPAPGLVAMRRGSGTGNYMITSGMMSWTWIDTTNLRVRVHTPEGSVVLCWLAGNVNQGTTAGCIVYTGIAVDTVGNTISNQGHAGQSGAAMGWQTMTLTGFFLGDGQNHDIGLVAYQSGIGGGNPRIGNYALSESPILTIYVLPAPTPPGQVLRRRGSGTGNIMASSTSWVWADTTNLRVTVDIPVGYVAMAWASGGMNAGSAAAGMIYAAISMDAPGNFIGVAAQSGAGSTTMGFHVMSVSGFVVGDGGSHQIGLATQHLGATNAYILNSNGANAPQMIVLVVPMSEVL